MSAASSRKTGLSFRKDDFKYGVSDCRSGRVIGFSRMGADPFGPFRPFGSFNGSKLRASPFDSFTDLTVF